MRMFCFFFFKQKTAYEMVMSDWSSDVCSSDLKRERVDAAPAGHAGAGSTKSAASKIAILDLPDSFTVPTLNYKVDRAAARNPGLPHRASRGADFLPQAVT